MEQFDQNIKKILENIETPFQEAHWHDLAERLESFQSQSAIDDPFDKAVKSVLTKNAAEYEDAHWQALKARLRQYETVEPNDAETVLSFDKSVSEKLEEFSFPFNEEEWLALRTRLIARAYAKKWVLHTKLFEGMVITLLSFLLWNTPHYHAVQGPAGVEIALNTTQRPPTSAPSGSLTDGEKDLNISKLPSGKKTKVYHSQKDATSSGKKSITPLNPLPALRTEVAASSSATDAVIKHWPLVQPPAAVAPLKTSLPVPAMTFAEDAIRVARPVRRFHAISAYGTATIHQVNTGELEFQDVVMPEGVLWSEPGAGFGVAWDETINNLTIRGAVEVSQFAYHPTPFLVLGYGNASVGYGGVATTKIKVRHVAFPLTFETVLRYRKRQRLLAHVGFEAAINDIQFHQKVFTRGGLETTATSEINAEIRQSTQFNPYWSDLLDYSSVDFAYNSDRWVPTQRLFTMHAIAGLSFEYDLASGKTTFVSADYRRQLSRDGIGRPNDLFHSINLNFGIKTYL